jgi:hypothetical protein
MPRFQLPDVLVTVFYVCAGAFVVLQTALLIDCLLNH